MPSGPVTRFAPSPTGHLHIGGARTALFNWALSRPDGRFLLRIEDTDRVRSTEDAARGILEDLAWLGIAWDEGPELGGLGGDPRGVGPFRQAERLGLYAEAVDWLVARDLAYPAFEPPEELDALRAEARAAKRAFRYRRPEKFDRDAALGRMRAEPHVVRFRMPDEPLTVVDRVLGPIAFGEDHFDDFVIRKRDGFPTYHLAVVVDDEAMGVTHVLRGQEHLNNTPRHVALQRALGYREPVYAHLPLIQNADGSKMSKRDKEEGRAVDVEDFRRAGFLPEVLCNYVALLGWSPGEVDAEGRDLERFDLSYLAERFSLERVGTGNARFDPEKLAAFNQAAIAELGDDAFFARWSEWCARYAPDALARDEAWRRRVAAALRTRCRTLADPTAPDGPGAFVWIADEAVAWESAAVDKWLRRGEPSGFARLAEARARLAALEPFEPDAIEAAVAELAASLGLGLGKLAQPLRVAVTGRAASPPLGDTLALLGRASALARVDRCLAELRRP